MKKYYFSWYNHIAQQYQTDFILAENITQAAQIAVMIMKISAGDMYSEDHIECLDEINDDYFYNIDYMKERYKKCNKEFILPEIEEYRED